MMHPHEWKQKGNIFLWSYEGNPSGYRGWHLHCSDTGCDSLVSLIDSFSGIKESVNRTIQLSKPTNRHFGVPGCKRKPLNDEKLVIANADQWAIHSNHGTTRLCVSENDISKLRDAVSGIKFGKGDYFIGSPGNELWFWW